MSEPITAAVSDRICKHMNEDHADAVLVYAQFFGQTPTATAAQMDSIDPQGMNLTAAVDGSPVPVRVTFDHPLESAKEAHVVLVEMLKQARPQPVE
jgi:putative heme iron utilization protein